MGLYLPDRTPYLIPQGVFYIKDPRETFMPSAKTINLPLVDMGDFTGLLFVIGNYVANIK